MSSSRLTDTEIRGLRPADKPYKVSVGQGLNVFVQPSGSKLWRLSYRFGGKQKVLALGRYPAVSLAEARRRRDVAKGQLADGVDPSAVRLEEKVRLKRQQQTPSRLSDRFDEVASRWLGARDSAWSAGYSARVASRVQNDLSAAFGDIGIGDVDSAMVLAALRKVEARGKLHMAQRIRRYAFEIFRFAKAEGLIAANPADELAPAMAVPPPKKRRAALKASEVGPFLIKLHAYDGEAATRLALLLAILTFVRTGELRFGRWSEVEGLTGASPLWRIPAERMKMRREHVVPLAPQAVEAMKAARKLAGKSDYFFPAAARLGVISENRMLFALYRMGYHSKATVHGFRSTASTILNEHNFNRDWIERQLAHVEQDQVRAAYNSADWLPQRREMMNWWADWLDEQRSIAEASINLPVSD